MPTASLTERSSIGRLMVRLQDRQGRPVITPSTVTVDQLDGRGEYTALGNGGEACNFVFRVPPGWYRVRATAGDLCLQAFASLPDLSVTMDTRKRAVSVEAVSARLTDTTVAADGGCVVHRARRQLPAVQPITGTVAAELLQKACASVSSNMAFP